MTIYTESEELYLKKIHQNFMDSDDPAPNSKISNLINQKNGLITFRSEDSNLLHKKLYWIARRFKDEMKTDCVAWSEDRTGVSPNLIGMLFCNKNGGAMGGGGICIDEQSENTPYIIDWLWIAPNFQRSGIFSKVLPELVEKYPGAIFRPPYSQKMQKLSKKSPYINIWDNGILQLTHNI